MNDNNRSIDEENDSGTDCCSILLMVISIILIVITFPISIFFCIRIVPEYERAIIFRLGRLKKVRVCGGRVVGVLVLISGWRRGPGIVLHHPLH